jgi:hypothetical protein
MPCFVAKTTVYTRVYVDPRINWIAISFAKFRWKFLDLYASLRYIKSQYPRENLTLHYDGADIWNLDYINLFNTITYDENLFLIYLGF